MSSPKITVIGIGEDGLDGLSPAARALVGGADLLVGGERHLAKVPEGPAERLDWSGGLDPAFDRIQEHLNDNRDDTVVVLASGDPSHFGVASALIRRFGADTVFTIPAPGAVSLACARMGWAVDGVQVATIHGRDRDRALETLSLFFTPGVKLVVLARDGHSPAEVAALLTAQGFGPSRMSVLEHMGGQTEKRIDGLAESWAVEVTADLATVCVELVSGSAARPWSRLAGLPDDAFAHDGQLTKREVRAVTLSSLAPLPGETLWDLGAGAGSIGIEWLRADVSCQAVAVERDRVRAARIAQNAATLGVPRLHIVQADVLDALNAHDMLAGAPDAIFVGGGVGTPGLLQAAWERLAPGGRLVVNAVTAEGAAALTEMKQIHGGELTQISVARTASKPENQKNAATLFEPMRTVTQYVGEKTVK